MENGKTKADAPRTLVAFVLSYSPMRKVYNVRPTAQNQVPFECPAIEYGTESPYSVGDKVAVHFYSDYGFVIVGRLPIPRSQQPLLETTPSDQRPADLKDAITYRPPSDKDDLAYAQAGDFSQQVGETKNFLGRAGLSLLQVATTCLRYMSATMSTIKDVCWRYIRSQPGITLVSEIDTKQDSPTVGQPRISLEVVPTLSENTTQMRLGGGVTPSGADGMDLIFGNLVRMLLSLTPGNPTLEYTHGENRTKVQIDLQQFLLQFGTAQFSWSDTGLRVTQGESTISLSAAGVLEIVSSSLTILISGSATLQAESLQVNADSKFVLPVNIQGFDMFTISTRLNQLILAFNAHIHQVGPVPSAPPTGAGAVLPVEPTV